MSQESPGLGQRAKSLVDHAKRRAGVGDPPLATEAGGRAAGMSEAFRAFGEGDLDRFLGAFADDVEWSAPEGEAFPGAGNHQGRDAVREAFLGDAKRSFATFGFRPERYLEAQGENIVVALGAFTGEGVKGTGQLAAPAVQVWEYDGDEVIAVAIYTDSAAFPGVVTEQEEKEAQEEQEKEESEGDEDERDDDARDEAEDGEEGAKAEKREEG
jgi:ketosteroid isomerase-like protein